MLSVAIFGETVVLADDLYHQRDGQMFQPHILGARSALRRGRPIDETLPDEFMKRLWDVRAGTAGTARLLAENLKCILVALPSECDQCLDLRDLHADMVELPADFLREQLRRVAYHPAHSLAGTGFSIFFRLLRH